MIHKIQELDDEERFNEGVLMQAIDMEQQVA